MTSPSETMSIVLAGGVGSRLAPLTNDRAKPAVPFGGQYRIIDFTLSNCLNSGLRRVLVLTQYKSQSLQKHLRDTWSIFNPELDEYITVVPPQLRTGDSWYQGTADAIYQNLYLLKRSGSKFVLVLSGDHIYRMNYQPLISAHRKSGADVTVSCLHTNLEEARAFGVLRTDLHDRVIGFQEKPQHPTPTPQDRNRALASMGIYVFSTDALCNELERDAACSNSTHDFGHDLLPRMMHTHQVQCYRYDEQQECSVIGSYWRDVGTIDAYYQANMDLLQESPPLDLNVECWPIRHYRPAAPPAHIQHDAFGCPGSVEDSLLSNGLVISGGIVRRSIVSTNVRIGSRAIIEDSILGENVVVGEGVHLQRCIVDKNVMIPTGTHIGLNHTRDAQRFHVSASGVVAIPKDYQFDRAIFDSKAEHSTESAVTPRPGTLSGT